MPWKRGTLYAPCKFARESVSDLIDIGADRASNRIAVAGIIVDAADDPSDDAFTLAAVKREIDGRTASQVSKIRLGEGPTPPTSIDPANQFIFN
jgi:hypothetical protein